jgi:hypothetical protein
MTIQLSKVFSWWVKVKDLWVDLLRLFPVFNVGKEILEFKMVRLFARLFFTVGFLRFLVTEERILGRGGFGDALLRMHKQKKIRCVVKRIPKIEEAEEGTESVQELLWKQEVAAMAAVSSRYIVKIFDAFEDEMYQHIVTEYCENGNLRDFLKRLKNDRTPLNEEVFCPSS